MNVSEYLIGLGLAHAAAGSSKLFRIRSGAPGAWTDWKVVLEAELSWHLARACAAPKFLNTFEIEFLGPIERK